LIANNNSIFWKRK